MFRASTIAPSIISARIGHVAAKIANATVTEIENVLARYLSMLEITA